MLQLRRIVSAAPLHAVELSPSKRLYMKIATTDFVNMAVASISGGVINDEVIQKVSHTMEGEDSGDPGR